jgi:HAD superfamily phosphatase (TIGR01668 family)
MSMIDLLCPRLYVSSLFDINLEDLCQRGIRGILFDLDNTIIPRHLDDFSAEVSCWMNEVRQRNFKACIFSNNKAKRVYALAELLGLPAVCQAAKPRRRAFRRALELMGTAPAETAIVGDQVFTDILGGNRLGLYTILVVPMPGREFWATRLINRQLEKFVLRRLWQNKAL